MGGWQVRSAVVSDLPGIADVAAANGLDDRDSGLDPLYVGHLLGRGRVLVAESATGEAIGFAGAIPVGQRWMLTDLFVRPDVQSRGVGTRLLRVALNNVSSWMTFSSNDLRAMSLYLRAGAVPRWPLLYLRGRLSPAEAPTDLDLEPVRAEEAARAEASFSGVDRAADYRYWAAEALGTAYLVRRGSDIVAAGCVRASRQEIGISHFAVSRDYPPTPPVLCLLAGLEAPVRVCLPGPHAATPTLLDQGFRIEGYDQFMLNGMLDGAEHRTAYDPGLC